jgi:Tfp pilus assembly protein PilF
MSECPRCHTAYLPDDKFCGGCGFNLAAQNQFTTICNPQDLNVSDIRINLGVIYLKQGKYAMAAQNFERVLEGEPDNTIAKKLLEDARIAQQREWS